MRIPGSVMTACILWIVYGALGILGGLASVGASTGVGAFQIVIGAMFLITGIQVLMGKASSVLGSGIVCIILASLGLFGAFGMTALAGSGLVTIIMVVNSTLLMVAGILACVGNEPYKRWVTSRR